MSKNNDISKKPIISSTIDELVEKTFNYFYRGDNDYFNYYYAFVDTKLFEGSENELINLIKFRNFLNPYLSEDLCFSNDFVVEIKEGNSFYSCDLRWKTKKRGYEWALDRFLILRHTGDHFFNEIYISYDDLKKGYVIQDKIQTSKYDSEGRFIGLRHKTLSSIFSDNLENAFQIIKNILIGYGCTDEDLQFQIRSRLYKEWSKNKEPEIY